MNRGKNIIVFLEMWGKKKHGINHGLLAEGNRIAAMLGGNLSVLIVGNPLEEPVGFDEYGVSTVYQIEGKGLDLYNDEVFAWAVKEVLRDIPFRLLLMAHSDKGRELAPRIAFFLHSVAITDCVDIRLREDVLYYVRSLYGGQLEQEISFAEPLPEIASLETDALNGKQAATSASLQAMRVTVEVCPDTARTTLLEVIPPDFRTVDILDAERVIGVGAGCSEVMDLVMEFADLTNGSIGTTRPVVDDGLVPKKRMIGQTGKTVSPELYVALGISGSPHHVAGIQQSKRILSLNRDTSAPILGFSDVGFICDLKSCLPKLINRIKRYRDQGLA
jgi:electron transfer flavoprotein alpha subunit